MSTKTFKTKNDNTYTIIDREINKHARKMTRN